MQIIYTTITNICLNYNIVIAKYSKLNGLTGIKYNVVQVMVLNQTVYVSYTCY